MQIVYYPSIDWYALDKALVYVRLIPVPDEHRFAIHALDTKTGREFIVGNIYPEQPGPGEADGAPVELPAFTEFMERHRL